MNKHTREKKVLEELKKSNEFHAKLYSVEPNDNSIEQPKSNETPIQPIVELKAQVTPKELEPIQQPVKEPELKSGPMVQNKVSVPTKETVKEPAKVDRQDDVYKARYETIIGKYNAEIPRYKDQLKELDNEVKRLKDIIVNVEQRRPQEVQSKPETSAPSKLMADTEITPFDIETAKYIKPEDNTDYGEGIVDLVVRGANEVAELKLKEYNSKITNYINSRIRQVEQKMSAIEDLQNKVTNVETKQHLSIQDKFYTDLNTLSSDWLSVRDTEEFWEWLNQPDPLSLFLRRDLLDTAIKDFDAQRVAALYNAYINSSRISPIISNEDFNKPSIAGEPEIVVTPEPTVNRNALSIDNVIQPNKVKVSVNQPVAIETPPNIGSAAIKIAKAHEDLKMRRITVDQYNDVVARETGAFYKDGKLVM